MTGRRSGGIMKNINRYFLLVNICAIALFLGGTASAQIVFKRNSSVVSTQTQPQPQADTWKPLPAVGRAGSVTAKVVWSEALGLPPMYPGASEASPTPCGLFIISVSNQRERIKASEGGTFTTDTGTQNYVCSYTIEGLPKGQDLRVTANFLDSRLWETAPWIPDFSADGAVPGAGQIRVLIGARIEMLTDAKPAVNVDFSVRYETPRRPIRIF